MNFDDNKKKLEKLSSIISKIVNNENITDEVWIDLIDKSIELRSILNDIFNEYKNNGITIDKLNLLIKNFEYKELIYIYLEIYEYNIIDNNKLYSDDMIKKYNEENFGNDSLQLYFKDISNFPLLTREEERKYAIAYKNGDLSAKEKLINSNLRLVVTNAKKYYWSNIEQLDLIEEGNIGLIIAVEKFNPEMGIKLSTYATCWINQKIQKAINTKSGMIYLPLEVKNKIKQIKNMIELGKNPIEISEKLGCSIEFINNILLTDIISLNRNLTGFTDDNNDELMDFIEDKNIDINKNIFNENLREELYSLLDTLSERDKMILINRFGIDCNPKTLQIIAEELGISKQAVEKAEKNAIKKLKNNELLNRLSCYCEE